MMAVLLFWQTRLLKNALWVCWLVAFWPRMRGGFVVLADQIACIVGKGLLAGIELWFLVEYKLINGGPSAGKSLAGSAERLLTER